LTIVSDVTMAILLNLGIRIVASLLNVPLESLSIFVPMIEPPSMTKTQAISDTLALGWNSMDGFDVIDEELLFIDSYIPSKSIYPTEEKYEDKVLLRDPRPSTYGEITELGARQLFWHMDIAPLKNMVSKSRVNFFDLGSGTGKLVIQAYMEIPRLRRAVGIEISPTRHSVAKCAWDKIKNVAVSIRAGVSKGENNAQVNLIEGDVFNVDISDATHIYVASLCFTDSMMDKLGEICVKKTDKLVCVASLKPFPSSVSSGLFLKKFKKRKIEFIEMSWTKHMGGGCVVYFYSTS